MRLAQYTHELALVGKGKHTEASMGPISGSECSAVAAAVAVVVS
jgi:hypothetical protein